MEKFQYIPYNSSNKDRARENRSNSTKAELLIRSIIRNKQTWYWFLRQKLLDSFIADYYCSKLLLVIEIDWESHADKENYDAIRTHKIHKLWIKVIRYYNEDVLKNIEWVYQDLIEQIRIRENELWI